MRICGLSPINPWGGEVVGIEQQNDRIPVSHTFAGTPERVSSNVRFEFLNSRLATTAGFTPNRPHQTKVCWHCDVEGSSSRFGSR